MEREIIADIARRVKKTGRYTETAELMAKSMVEQGYSASKIQAEVMKLLRADKAYQMAVAENTKAYKRQVQEIIDKTLEETNKGNKELIAEAANMAWNNDLSMWQEHGVNLKEPNSMSQLMAAFQIQTAKELKNITRTTGFRNTVLGTTGVLNAYQKELDLAVLKIASGTFSYDQAVNDCVTARCGNGIQHHIMLINTLFLLLQSFQHMFHIGGHFING
ncbi:MAG: phage minor capsid protein, partial [Lachnospiraceae bacterium]